MKLSWEDMDWGYMTFLDDFPLYRVNRESLGGDNVYTADCMQDDDWEATFDTPEQAKRSCQEHWDEVLLPKMIDLWVRHRHAHTLPAGGQS